MRNMEGEDNHAMTWLGRDTERVHQNMGNAPVWYRHRKPADGQRCDVKLAVSLGNTTKLSALGTEL
jgi:hypothetical protein